jgi:predicted esterase
MNILHNPAWYIPHLLQRGDVPTIASAIEGQDVLIRSGAHDPIFPSWAVPEVASAIPSTHVDFQVFEGGHEFPPEVQAEALRWLSEVLSSSE